MALITVLIALGEFKTAKVDKGLRRYIWKLLIRFPKWSTFLGWRNLSRTVIISTTTYNHLANNRRPKIGPSSQATEQLHRTYQPGPKPQELSQDELWLVNTLNSQRVSAELKPMIVDSRIMATARLKALDLVQNNYYSHVSPTYGPPHVMMKSFGILGYSWMGGENIIAARSIQEGYNNWVISPGHRKNMFSTLYTAVGVGIVSYPAYGVMMVMQFAG